MKDPKLVVKFLAVLAGAAAVALTACSHGGEAAGAGQPRRSVEVAPLGLAPLGSTLHAVGLLAPKDQARLSFKVGGYIESIPVEEGQRVKSGQRLAQLKNTEYGAALEQARQGAAKALRDLNRGKALLADGVTSEEQVQDLATAYQIASAAERSAAFNAQHGEILAPGDGVVMQKLAQADELVQAGQPVLVVGTAGRGWVVRVGLADRDVVRVHVGDAAGVEFDAWPGRKFAGRVGNVASAADPATGTFTVEIQVEPAAAPFVEGLVAKASIEPRDAPSVAVLPVQALIEANGDEAGVFVLDADGTHVHRATVQIGRMSEGRVEVRGGLAAGALVVVEGGAFLDNGEAVRVARSR